MNKNDTSRRGFIKKAGATLLGAAAALTAPGIASAATNTKKPLTGRTAFITGAARGIGAATALKLAQQGANIALIDIASPDALKTIPYKLASKDDLLKTEAKIKSTGAKTISITADVRDRSALKAAARQTADTFGGIDIVIANAAIGTSSAPFEHESEQTLKNVLEINVAGVANTASATLPYLKNSNHAGSFTAISSISGRRGMKDIATYTASKWAVIGFIKSLCLEWGQYNIRVNSIAPTGVKTHMLLGALAPDAALESLDTPQMNQFLNKYHSLPSGLLEPKDIADAAAFLCSDEAKHISGITLDVNAGWSGKLTG